MRDQKANPETKQVVESIFLIVEKYSLESEFCELGRITRIMDVSFGKKSFSLIHKYFSKLYMDLNVYSAVVCSDLMLIPGELVPMTLSVHTITARSRV